LLDCVTHCGNNQHSILEAMKQFTLALIARLGVTLLPAQPVINATVDPAFPLVTNFAGWGTSLCWWANVTGGYANRNDYAALAFTTLKLNLVRYNIGGGENPGIPNTLPYRARVPGFEPTNGVWNWSADANQRWMLRQAGALGADQVIAFANSPPWWMTVSGSVTGSTNGTGNNLQTGYETNLASYLATVVSHLTVLDGVNFTAVTPVNEPMAAWWKYGGRQEGCHMDANQQARVVNALRAALNLQNPAIGIDASEDNDEQSTINSLKTYGTSHTNVTCIASHSYSANNPTGLRHLSASLHTPAWISEYGDGDGTGITMARRIHDDITGAWVRAWIYWQVVDNAAGWGLLYNPLRGSGNTAYTINEKFYVLGQFSRYIRPGFQILNVNDNYSLAAYQPTNQTLVIVAVNDTTNRLRMNYQIAGFASRPVQISAVRTSATENISPLAAIPFSNQSFSAALIPKSVTTFVLTNVAPPATAGARQAW
jgi:O-glycosyl hydrolase